MEGKKTGLFSRLAALAHSVQPGRGAFRGFGWRRRPLFVMAEERLQHMRGRCELPRLSLDVDFLSNGDQVIEGGLAEREGLLPAAARVRCGGFGEVFCPADDRRAV